MISIVDLNIQADPLREYNHEIFIPIVPGGGNPDSIRLKVLSTQLPGFSNSPVDVDIQGVKTRYSSKADFTRNISMSLVEDSQMNAINTLRRWWILEGTPTTGQAAPSNLYRTVILLHVLSSLKTVTQTYFLYNAFVSSVTDTPVSGASGGLVTFNATFSYDWWDNGIPLL